MSAGEGLWLIIARRGGMEVIIARRGGMERRAGAAALPPGPERNPDEKGDYHRNPDEKGD